jgi:glutaredoxin-like YruB-family protein
VKSIKNKKDIVINMTKIKLYSTPTCPWCHRAKDYLDIKGIEYENIDVSQDHNAAMEMVKKSGQMGVPQIEINGKMIVGFDQAVIDAELKKIKDPLLGKIKITQ